MNSLMKYAFGTGAAALLLNFAAFAHNEGGWSGGGGNALVCFDSKDVTTAVRENGHQVSDEQLARITSIESVDLLEAKLPRGFFALAGATEIIGIADYAGPQSFVNVVAYRFYLGGVQPIQKMLQESSEKIATTNILKTKTGIPFSDDANLMVPYDSDRCTLVTVARQYQRESTVFLYLDDRLFGHEKHTYASQNTIFLHEVVYLKAREMGQVDSRNTRLLVGQLIRKNDVSVGQTMKLYQDLGFGSVNYKNTKFYYDWQTIRGGLVKHWTAAKLAYDEENRGEFVQICETYYAKSKEACGAKATPDLERMLRVQAVFTAGLKGDSAKAIDHYIEYSRKRMEALQQAFSDEIAADFSKLAIDTAHESFRGLVEASITRSNVSLMQSMATGLAKNFTELTRHYAVSAIIQADGSASSQTLHGELFSALNSSNVTSESNVGPLPQGAKYVMKIVKIGCSITGSCRESLPWYDASPYAWPSDFIETTLTEINPGVTNSPLKFKYVLHFENLFERGADTWELGGVVDQAMKSSKVPNIQN